MGIHGGATAEAQRAIVEGFGITEGYLGVPIKATTAVVQAASIAGEIPVYFDKYAYAAHQT